MLAPVVSMWAALIAGGIAIAGRRRAAALSLIAVGVMVGAASAAWHVRSLRRGVIPTMAAHRDSVDVIAKLVRDPTLVTTRTGTPLTIVDATVTSVLDGGWRRVDAPVLVLSFSSGWTGLLPGQRVELVGTLASPRRGDDVTAVLDARAPPVPIGQPPWWQRATGRVRIGLEAASRGLPADERGLLPGLVDGDVTAEPPDLTADMRVTGLTHLQAVSGENVTVVLTVVLALARSIGIRRRARVAVALLALVAFVVLARPSPSVQRAAVMGAIAMLALATGRRSAAIPALSAAVLLLVVLNPFLARAVGFVLSVCATAAILLLAPRWTDRLATRMPRPLATAIAVPAAAQVACTPVLVMVFGQLTPYAIPANLVAGIAVVPATVLGVTTAVIAAGSPVAASPVAWLAAAPTALIAAAARGFAILPGAGLTWSKGAGLGLLAAAVGIAVLSRRVWRHRVSGQRAILGTWQR
jgi:competence protein ComEC